MQETYKVVEAFGYGDKLIAISNLSAQVNDHMRNGWRPQGGVQIGHDKPETGAAYWWAIQAMTRDSNYKERPNVQAKEFKKLPDYMGEGLA